MMERKERTAVWMREARRARVWLSGERRRGGSQTRPRAKSASGRAPPRGAGGGRLNRVLRFSVWRAGRSGWRVSSVNDLGEFAVRLRSRSIVSILQNARVCQRRFFEPYAVRHDVFEDRDALAEVGARGGDDFARVQGAQVGEGEQHAEYGEGGVGALLQFLDRKNTHLNSTQREVISLQGNDNFARGRERVGGEDAERGRAVEQDVVVGLGERGQAVAQRKDAERLADEVNLGGGKLDGRGDEGLAAGGREDCAVEWIILTPCGLHEGMVNGNGEFVREGAVRRSAQREGEGGLRVEVYEQRRAPALPQRRAEVDGGGGFAHPAFLICDGDDAGHITPPSPISDSAP